MFSRSTLSSSLSKLNAPPVLLSAAGLVDGGESLGLYDRMPNSPLLTKLGFVFSLFIVNMLSVAVPGRLDEQAYSNESKNKLAPLSPTKGTTLVAPAGWAFAIWGLIYSLEIISVIAICLTGGVTVGRGRYGYNPVLDIAGEISIPFFKASAFQALWCAAFRPRYFFPSSHVLASYVSFLMLSLTSLNLLDCLRLVGRRRKEISSIQFFSCFFPIGIHAGWTLAASLVNLNGSFAYGSARKYFQDRPALTGRIRAILGHGSVVAAVSIGAFVVLDDKIFQNCGATVAFTLAWALKAVQSGMKQRIESNGKGTRAESRQQVLAGFGALATGVMGIYGLFKQQ